MLFFPNAKINIGLNITEKRQDGFHNLETVFYPINVQDALEFVETNNETSVHTSGIELDVSNTDNICYTAYKLMANHYDLPQLTIHLHKFIPVGAGLGGGSSDAAFFIQELNNFFNLGISTKQLEKLASIIGSDCAFFIQNTPVFACGRGDIFEPVNLDLSNYYIYIIKPNVSVNTGLAFSGITPQKTTISVKKLINKPLEQWKDCINNDFERIIFKQHPVLSQIKHDMYDIGALYASMSGSGSAIYGIFSKKPKQNPKYKSFFNWIGKL